MASPSANPSKALDPDLLMRDLPCPVCGYNLRGLAGDCVPCPECGEQIDKARLLTEQWDKPWYRAPKFNWIIAPGVWCLFSLLIFLLVGQTLFTMNSSPWLLLIVAMVAVAGWVYLLFKAHRLFQNMRVMGLVLLGHVLVVGFFAGGIGCFISALWLFSAIVHFDNGGTLLFAAGSLVLFAGLIYVSRLGERGIARYCIRWHLQQQAVVPHR